MKRVIAALLSLSLCVALCSCKSRKATAADNMILDIGEVTLNSENDIVQAENAVNALKETDYEQLEHLETLKKARAVYDDLSAKKDAKRAIAAIDKISEMISLDDKFTIQFARKVYDSCTSDAQKYVTNYDKLLTAENSFSELKIEKVITSILSIGTVTLKSQTDVVNAKLLYNNLTPNEQSKVSNSGVLFNAIETLSELQDEKRAQDRANSEKEELAKLNELKDQRTINISGKQVWKVYAKSSELHFTGNFNGSGYFGIKILDSNQDFFDLVVNEIGDYIIDKTIYGLVPDEMYYIQIECTEGSWSCSWTGTYGR